MNWSGAFLSKWFNFVLVVWVSVYIVVKELIYCLSLAGASVLISGYSSFTPGSHVNFGQQYGNGAVLFVLSASNLQRSFAIGNGPQSSTNSWSLCKNGITKSKHWNSLIREVIWQWKMVNLPAAGIIGCNTCWTSTEWSQIPRFTWFNCSTSCWCKTHSREI